MGKKNTNQRFGFNVRYLFLFILLFAIELYIGFYVHDDFVRPYIGDFLVVVLLYFFLKIFWQTNNKTIAITVLVYSFIVEILQYFHLADKLHLSADSLAYVLIGNTFSWGDMIVYTMGTICVWTFDTYVLKSKKS